MVVALLLSCGRRPGDLVVLQRQRRSRSAHTASRYAVRAITLSRLNLGHALTRLALSLLRRRTAVNRHAVLPIPSASLNRDAITPLLLHLPSPSVPITDLVPPIVRAMADATRHASPCR